MCLRDDYLNSIVDNTPSSNENRKKAPLFHSTSTTINIKYSYCFNTLYKIIKF